MQNLDLLHDLEIHLDNVQELAETMLRQVAITRALIDPDIPQYVKQSIIQCNSIEMIEGGK